MRFVSTNGTADSVSLRQAVLQGLAPDGGLYVPEQLPRLPERFFDFLPNTALPNIAFAVASAFTDEDVLAGDLRSIIENSLTFPSPLVPIHGDTFALELFHGPTLAFKDFGARFMARLLSYFVANNEQELTILVATSGDTGTAVAHGFYNVPNIRVVILFPKGRVSKLQEQQLTTIGGNVSALEIEGSFDDCQHLVKQAFCDEDLRSRCALTSANSINIGRLIPQICYYFSAFAQLPNTERPVIISVPSGNFGNLCGGLLAKTMGLPVSRFIAATNRNDVVPQYLDSGDFLAKPSVETLSNAMDVGNPSNFARMLWLYNNDLDAIRADVHGSVHSDEETLAAIRDVDAQNNYLLDPHGAVGYLGLKAYRDAFEKDVAGIFLACAHPAKFAETIEKATGKTIPLPPALKQALAKQKQSLPLNNSLDELKEFLLKK